MYRAQGTAADSTHLGCDLACVVHTELLEVVSCGILMQYVVH